MSSVVMLSLLYFEFESLEIDLTFDNLLEWVEWFVCARGFLNPIEAAKDGDFLKPIEAVRPGILYPLSYSDYSDFKYLFFDKPLCISAFCAFKYLDFDIKTN